MSKRRLSLNFVVVLLLLGAILLPAAILLADTGTIHRLFTPYIALNLTRPNAPPDVPALIEPLYAASDVHAGDVLLRWSDGDPDGDALTWSVVLEANDATPDMIVASNLGTAALVFPANGLTTYYWQVIATDVLGARTAGPVWHFTTGACTFDLDLDVPRVVGQYVTFDGAITSTCDSISRITWDWGDGVNGDQFFPATHTYADAAAYSVTATAFNDQGVSHSDSLRIYAGPAYGVCSYVTQIPQSECEALVAIYMANNGPNWDVAPGWIVLTDPCVYEWEGVWCEDDHVTQLYLNNKNVTGVIPSQISNLLNLRDLNLGRNAITALPSSLSQLSGLQTLSVRYNPALSGPLPDGWANLTNLDTLYFDGTSMCVPVTGPIPGWLSTVDFVVGNGVVCP